MLRSAEVKPFVLQICLAYGRTSLFFIFLHTGHFRAGSASTLVVFLNFLFRAGLLYAQTSFLRAGSAFDSVCENDCLGQGFVRTR